MKASSLMTLNQVPATPTWYFMESMKLLQEVDPNGKAQAPICSSKGGLACLIDPVVDSCSYFILLNRFGIFLLWLHEDSWCEPFIVPNEAIALISVKICGLKQRWDLTALFPVQLLRIIPTYWGQK